MKQYKVTRLFIEGILKGLTYTAITTVKFDVGFISDSRFGSQYKIIVCEEV